jgi:RNA polymerase sigma factor (TIGR02999 family)
MNSSPKDPRLPEQGETPEVLVTLLYQELRRLAAGCLRRERPNHTLQPTALVNEAWLRMAAQSQPGWNGKVQFLAVASHLMREILIDYARTRNRAKRGGGLTPICVEDAGELAAVHEVDLVALDDALNVLEQVDTQQRQIVELRYFGGLNIEETAQLLGVSPATVKRDWRMARAWLHRELSSSMAHES